MNFTFSNYYCQHTDTFLDIYRLFIMSYFMTLRLTLLFWEGHNFHFNWISFRNKFDGWSVEFSVPLYVVFVLLVNSV